MRRTMAWLTIFFSLLLIVSGLTGLALSADKPARERSAPTATAPAPPDHTVLLITIDDPITPMIAEFIIKSIDKAAKQNAEALIIQMDTPGGLVESTREIIKKMLASDVPTVVYVAPEGSRAASAGVFITLTANIAAMAPNTRMG